MFNYSGTWIWGGSLISCIIFTVATIIIFVLGYSPRASNPSGFDETICIVSSNMTVLESNICNERCNIFCTGRRCEMCAFNCHDGFIFVDYENSNNQNVSNVELQVITNNRNERDTQEELDSYNIGDELDCLYNTNNEEEVRVLQDMGDPTIFLVFGIIFVIITAISFIIFLYSAYRYYAETFEV